MTTKDKIELFWPLLEDLTDDEKSALIEKLRGSMKSAPADSETKEQKKTARTRKDPNRTVTEVRDHSDFTGVANQGCCDVTIKTGESFKVEVIGKQKSVDDVETTVRGGVLHIKTKSSSYGNSGATITINGRTIISGSGDMTTPAKVNVILPELTLCSGAGSGNISIDSPIRTGHDFSLTVSGSGDIKAKEIECAGINAAISGSGNLRASQIKAHGSASVSVTGSGDVNLQNVDIDGHTELRITGSGDIRISGKAQEVNASVVGSGDISGHLNYTTIRSRVMGSGDIRI